jgi:hypothetical protein
MIPAHWLDLELPLENPPAWPEEKLNPSEWDEWLRRERIAREKAGTLLHDPLPEAKEPFVMDGTDEVLAAERGARGGASDSALNPDER